MSYWKKMVIHDRDIPNNDDRVSHGKSPYRDIDRDLDIPPHGYPWQYPISDIPYKNRDILFLHGMSLKKQGYLAGQPSRWTLTNHSTPLSRQLYMCCIMYMHTRISAICVLHSLLFYKKWMWKGQTVSRHSTVHSVSKGMPGLRLVQCTPAKHHCDKDLES